MKLFQSLHFVSKHLAVSSEANEILGMAGLPKAEGCHLESIKAIGSCNDQDMYTGLFLTPFVFAFAFLSFLQNSTELVRNDWVPQTVKCCTVLKCLDKGFSMCITANSSKITESRVQHAVNICRYHWMTTTVALGIEGSLLVYFAFCPPLFGDNAQITSGKHVPTAPKDNFRLHPFCVRSWRAALLKLKVFSLMGVSLSGTPSHHGFQYVSILKWSMTWMIWGYPRDLIHLDTIHLQPSRWVPITQAMAAVAQCCPERKRTMRCGQEKPKRSLKRGKLPLFLGKRVHLGRAVRTGPALKSVMSWLHVGS